MSDEPEPVIRIGDVEPSSPEDTRFTGIIWGPSGMGKTTLACTMPGRKALVNFDPDGPTSILHAPDVKIFDLSGMSDTGTAVFKSDDPFNLRRTFDHFDSYIIDSTTSIVEKTLARGISLTKGATVERPSPGAYQARNNLLLSLVRSILRITSEAHKHVCFVSHESAPMTDDEGRLLGYTMALGGQLPNSLALRINEVWPMFEDAQNRKMIITRKSRLRDPAKSRMFKTAKGQTEFEWRFDPDDWNNPKNKGARIEDWIETWEKGGYNKIDMPK